MLGGGTRVREGKGVLVGSGGGIASEAAATAAIPRTIGTDNSASGRFGLCKPALPERTPAEIRDDGLRPALDTHDGIERG